MKLALFDGNRLGVALPAENAVADVTAALPWPHDPDPLGAGWWRLLCRDYPEVRSRIDAALPNAPRHPLDTVTLRAPVLNPSKVIACAVNYHEHAAEMRDGILQRTGSSTASWMLDFDTFLKAPSSIVGPQDAVVLPRGPVAEGREIHHESELAFIVGKGGADIPEDRAMAHIFGYTIGLDMTVRGQGDRSRRKSYDTFTPVGPWVVTADEISDPNALRIRLTLNGEERQNIQAGEMIVKIPGIVAYASRIMRLEPGDIVLTGAPPGVGQVHAGDVMETTIDGIGTMTVPVRNSE